MGLNQGSRLPEWGRLGEFAIQSGEYSCCSQELKGGTALFTQPPMPIKCADAPQKPMYWSADGTKELITRDFDMRHVVPPQKAPDFILISPLVTQGAVQGEAEHDGYGSCPFTIERGKIVLAEFLYGGNVAPSFPEWLIDGTRPSAVAWYLKERVLPPLYSGGMLKGREWQAKPEMVG